MPHSTRRDWRSLRLLLTPLILAVLSFSYVVADETAAEQAPLRKLLPGYADPDGISQRLQKLKDHPLAELQSLGKTAAGRDVWLLTLGKREENQVKPAILLMAGVDPRQLYTTELAVALAEELLKQSDNKDGKQLLKQCTIYLVAQASPDAAAALFRTPLADRQANLRPTDDDNDGLIDEDGPDDLNGDGLITWMRVSDPQGNYRVHPDDDRVLIKVDPKKQEAGEYSLYSEGIDNDQDGKFNEDPLGGTALNRNFTFDYHYFTAGAGPHQVSEPESRALADFAFNHPEIAVTFALAPNDNLMQPWKAGNDNQRIKTSVRGDDATELSRIAAAYRKLHGGKDAPSSPDGKGAVVPWAYYHLGRWSLGANPWWVPKVEAEEGKESRAAGELNQLRWLEREKIDGFVPWQTVEHPDFPDQKVEVGGFKPLVIDNPPHDQIEPLVDKYLKFLGELAGMLPQVEIEEFTAKPLGGGIFRVEALVRNTGQLSTMTDMGRINDEAYPLILELKLPEGATLLQGNRRRQLPRLAPQATSHTEWLLRVRNVENAKLELRVASPSVGQAEKSIELKDKK